MAFLRRFKFQLGLRFGLNNAPGLHQRPTSSHKVLTRSHLCFGNAQIPLRFPSSSHQVLIRFRPGSHQVSTRFPPCSHQGGRGREDRERDGGRGGRKGGGREVDLVNIFLIPSYTFIYFHIPLYTFVYLQILLYTHTPIYFKISNTWKMRANKKHENNLNSGPRASPRVRI